VAWEAVPSGAHSFQLALTAGRSSLVAVWLGWWASGAQKQKRAVAWVKEHRGAVYYEHQWEKPPGSSGWLQYADGYGNRDLKAAAHPLRGWLGDDFFLTVRGAEFLWWEKAQISFDDLEHLAAFPALRSLSLHRMGIGDEGLSHIGRLTSLRTLCLQEEISDAGLEQLTRLEHLESLFLHSPRITDEGLKPIARLRNLRVLRVTESSITGKGLPYLRDLPKLEYLALCQSPINRTGLERAKSLSQLKELDLKVSGVSNEDAQALRESLPGCKITN
jgi:hypothetical protein